jgi:hypothetical protein
VSFLSTTTSKVMAAPYLVNNTQEKQVYFQHEIIARATVIICAEGEMAKIYEQAVPPPQVNGVRQGQVKRRQPPNKVPPGTPLSAEEEALCKELNLENRYFLRGKSQAKRRQRVKEIITRWKSVFTDETTKVGDHQARETKNHTPHPSTGRNLEKTTSRLDSRRHHCPLRQCMGLTLGPGNEKRRNSPLGH